MDNDAKDFFNTDNNLKPFFKPDTLPISIDDATPEDWNKISIQSSWSKGIERKHNEVIEKFDEVSKPQHYNFGKYETIDVIVDTLGEFDAINYCHGNVLKYVVRARHKGKPIQDCEKAVWYLNKMVELLNKTKGVNW
jgi:hypothetical protein